MRSHTSAVVCVVLMVILVVGIDVLFLRNRFWERLAVNIGIVVAFAAIYFGLLRR